MSDKNCLTHRLETDNSNSKDKPIKDEVIKLIYNIFKQSNKINKNKIYFKSNNKISSSNSHNRKIKSGFLLANKISRRLDQYKTSSVRVHQEKNSLIQKCQLKFNSFLTEKNIHKSNLKTNTRDYFMNMIKSQKKNYLNNNKKTITTSSINNNSLKQYKILKSNKVHHKNKIKLNSENDKNKKRKEISNNFDRNNKFIENIYFDDENSTNLININRSNYKIKVKTKINHIDNDKNTLNKNSENIDGIEEKNSDENDDNKNDTNCNNSNQLNSINVTSEKRKHNKTFGKAILPDISTKNIRRYQYSNSITKKHIKRFKELQKEKKDCLEKVKFIQLWWKTIFQIIKIQKHLRGFLYRQKLIEELDRLQKRKPQIQDEIARAREHGDLRENAEYHAAKEALTNLMQRIAEIDSKLSRAKIIEELNIDPNKVFIGVTVTIKDEDGDEYEYAIVDEEEANPNEMKISIGSPLAQGLLGHVAGDKVDVELPAGTMKFEIVKITR